MFVSGTVNIKLGNAAFADDLRDLPRVVFSTPGQVAAGARVPRPHVAVSFCEAWRMSQHPV